MNRPIFIQGLGSFADVAASGPPQQAAAISAQFDKVISAARRAIVEMRAKSLLVPTLTAIKPTLLDQVLGPIGLVMAAARGYVALDETTKSVSGALDNMAKLVDKLDTTDRAQVMAGTLAPEKWIAAMQAIQEGIYALGQGLGDNDPATILWNQLVEAKNLLAKIAVGAYHAAGSTLDWLKWALPLTLAGGIGIALLLNPATRGAMTAAGDAGKAGAAAAKAAAEAAKAAADRVKSAVTKAPAPAPKLSGLSRRRSSRRRISR